MKPLRRSLLLILPACTLIACSVLPIERANTELSPWARSVLAPGDGWASLNGGTRGGADAAAADVFTVSSRSELLAALAGPARPRIIQVRGRIDLSADAQGRALQEEDFRDPAFSWPAYEAAYAPATWGKAPPNGPQEEARLRSARRQSAHTTVRIPSDTTLVGLGPEAGFKNGMLLLDGVQNIIVRGLHLSDAYDFFPAWDPKDNASGEWNSEYDNLSLRGARRVWVDHCTFDDGARPDRAERWALGRPMQHHDGLLDITQQSDLVTVSWSHFRDHDKTHLIGSSDSRSEDAGHLRVSFHHNHWERTQARTPRVRYGQVHLYNNLFSVPDLKAYDYSIGVGVQSRVLSEANVWRSAPGLSSRQLVKWWKGQHFADRGSLHNGQPVDLLAELRAANPGAVISSDLGWQPLVAAPVEPADQVEARVRAGAGAGLAR